MKNEDIKVHSNIMKIFKYLVFTFFFFTFQLFIGVDKVNAYNFKEQNNQKKCDLTTKICYSRYRNGTGFSAWKQESEKAEFEFSQDAEKISFNVGTKDPDFNIFVCNKYKDYTDSSCKTSDDIKTTVENYWGKLGVEIQKNGKIIEHGNEHNGKFAWPWTQSSELVNWIDKENSSNFYDKFIKGTDFEKDGFRLYVVVDTAFSPEDVFYYVDTYFFTKPTATISVSTSGWQKEHKAELSIASTNPNKDLRGYYCVSGYNDLDSYGIINRSKDGFYKSDDTSHSCYSSSFDTGSTSKSLTKNGLTGTYYIYLYAVDYNNNRGVIIKKEIKLDNRAPTISYTRPESETVGWVQSYTLENVEASDDHSGVKDTQYCWSTSATIGECVTNKWQTLSGTSINSDNLSGEFYLHIKAEDKAGNTNEIVVMAADRKKKQVLNVTYTTTSQKQMYLNSGFICSEIKGVSEDKCTKTTTTTIKGGIVLFKVDAEVPKYAFKIVDKEGNEDKNGLNSSWTKNTKMNITIEENYSGIKSAILKYKEGIDGNGKDTKFSDSTVIQLKEKNVIDWEEIIGTIHEGVYACIEIYDNAGNYKDGCTAIYIDNVGPTIDVATSFRENAKDGVDGIIYLNPNDIITYTLTIKDNILGISDASIINIIEKKPYDTDHSIVSCTFNVTSKKTKSKRKETRSGGVFDVITELEVVYAVSCSKTTKLKVAFSTTDEVGNASESASYGSFVSEFYIDGNGGVTVGGGEVVDGDFKGLFDIIKNKDKAAPQSKQIKIVEEVEIVEVQIKDNKLEIDVVEDEDIVNVEYSIENEEYKVLEDNIVELGNNDIYHLSVRANLVNDILEKKFLVLKEKEKFVLKRLA